MAEEDAHRLALVFVRHQTGGRRIEVLRGIWIDVKPEIREMPHRPLLSFRRSLLVVLRAQLINGGEDPQVHYSSHTLVLLKSNQIVTVSCCSSK
ncbi:hypothetical protein PRIPAC_87617, partial [Pristionchus pacificus]|uniref:Uncharacterized protein n=1 Tax=Pristionchus pacificus TaxID=54126 RepID=A0A2A6CTX0_PRIPA